MLQRLNGRPRRILMTTDAVGGVWQYALGLARALVDAGDSVVLAGLGPRPSAEQEQQARAVATLCWLDTPPDWIVDREDALNELGAELAPLLRDHAIDILHLNAPSQAAGLPASCPVVAVSHSCVVTWFHAVRGTATPEDWAWQQARNRRGFDRADIVVAPSASHASMLIDCYGEIPRLAVVHNAIPASIGNSRREDIVFAAGRWWDEGKNAGVLDEAAALTKWPIFAAGSTTGPNGQATTFHNAVALGSMPNEEVRRLMATCGIFVSPSTYEPFGLAALEAAHSATPLVLADIPTYRELWDGAALFFPPRDAGALAAAIDRLAAHPLERSRLGEAARRRSRRYTPARQVAAMRSVYDRAAAIFAEER